jgi:hypothetical protein
LKRPFEAAEFSLEDLEILANMPNAEGPILLGMTKGPIDYTADQVLLEYREGSDKVRQVLFYSCKGRDFFPDLFEEAWGLNAALVRSMARAVPPKELGPLLLAANAGKLPKITGKAEKQPQLEFDSKEVDSFFRSLPLTKRKAATRFFIDYEELGPETILNQD